VARKKSIANTDPIDPNGLSTNDPPAEEPAFVTARDFEQIMANAPPDPPAPPPPPPPAPSTDALEERMRRLEESITNLARMQREPAPPPPGQSVMGAAQALVQAGRHLLPPVQLSAAPPPGQAGRLWFFTDMLAELQAIYFMYVDPRYRLSWVGRLVPPLLLVLFLASEWWVKYAFCGLGALPFVHKPIELMLCYLMYKVVSLEARYYRQTSPDLPPSLRL
jgi:hypothetical protein